MHKVESIIKELELNMCYDKNSLFEKFVNDRLELILNTYYDKLQKEFDNIGIKVDLNLKRTIKKIYK